MSSLTMNKIYSEMCQVINNKFNYPNTSKNITCLSFISKYISEFFSDAAFEELKKQKCKEFKVELPSINKSLNEADPLVKIYSLITKIEELINLVPPPKKNPQNATSIQAENLLAQANYVPKESDQFVMQVSQTANAVHEYLNKCRTPLRKEKEAAEKAVNKASDNYNQIDETVYSDSEEGDKAYFETRKECYQKVTEATEELDKIKKTQANLKKVRDIFLKLSMPGITKVKID